MHSRKDKTQAAKAKARPEYFSNPSSLWSQPFDPSKVMQRPVVPKASVLILILALALLLACLLLVHLCYLQHSTQMSGFCALNLKRSMRVCLGAYIPVHCVFCSAQASMQAAQATRSELCTWSLHDIPAQGLWPAREPCHL